MDGGQRTSARFALRTPDGRQYPIHGTTIIGRSRGSHISLRHALVSRQRATVWADQGGLWVRDEGSSNGTFVNGTRITHPTRLQTGDQLGLGSEILIVADVSMLRQAAPVPAPRPPHVVQPVYPPPPVAPPARRSRYPVYLMSLGAIGIVVICLGIAAAVGGYYLLIVPSRKENGPTRAVDLPTPIVGTTPETIEPTPEIVELPEEFEIAAVQTTAVSADGIDHADERGVRVAVPTDALPAGKPAQVTASELGPHLKRLLKQHFDIGSMAYSVSTQDQDDGTGHATLKLPASSPDDRLAVIVDRRYVGLLSVRPQDGYLAVSPRLGPADPASPSNQYVVLKRKEEPGSSFEGLQPASFDGLLETGTADPLVSPQSAKLESCWDWYHTYCVKNPAGAVFLMYSKEVKDKSKLINVMDTAEAVVNAYKTAGLKAASVSTSNPLYIVITDGGLEYSWKTGNMYINWVTLEKIAEPTQRYNLAHELAHWVQDEEYVMGISRLSGEKTWWLEVAAENMCFLYDAGCMNVNLRVWQVDGAQRALAPQLSTGPI